MNLFAKVYLRGLKSISYNDILGLDQNTTRILIGEIDISSTSILARYLKQIYLVFKTPLAHTYDDENTIFYTSTIHQGRLVILRVIKNKITTVTNMYLHHSPLIDSSVFDDLVKILRG
jgi:hypothetical protein